MERDGSDGGVTVQSPPGVRLHVQRVEARKIIVGGAAALEDELVGACSVAHRIADQHRAGLQDQRIGAAHGVKIHRVRCAANRARVRHRAGAQNLETNATTADRPAGGIRHDDRGRRIGKNTETATRDDAAVQIIHGEGGRCLDASAVHARGLDPASVAGDGYVFAGDGAAAGIIGRPNGPAIAVDGDVGALDGNAVHTRGFDHAGVAGDMDDRGADAEGVARDDSSGRTVASIGHGGGAGKDAGAAAIRGYRLDKAVCIVDVGVDDGPDGSDGGEDAGACGFDLAGIAVDVDGPGDDAASVTRDGAIVDRRHRPVAADTVHGTADRPACLVGHRDSSAGATGDTVACRTRRCDAAGIDDRRRQSREENAEKFSVNGPTHLVGDGAAFGQGDAGGDWCRNGAGIRDRTRSTIDFYSTDDRRICLVGDGPSVVETDARAINKVTRLGDRAAIDEAASSPTEKNSAEAALDCALVRDGPYRAGVAKDRINSSGRCRIDVRPGTENDLALERVKIEGRGLNGSDRGLRLRIARHTNTERHDHRGHGKCQARRATQQTHTERAAYGAAHTIPRFNGLHPQLPNRAFAAHTNCSSQRDAFSPCRWWVIRPDWRLRWFWRGSMLKERDAGKLGRARSPFGHKRKNELRRAGDAKLRQCRYKFARDQTRASSVRIRRSDSHPLIPAQAGIHGPRAVDILLWIPAFAGTSGLCFLLGPILHSFPRKRESRAMRSGLRRTLGPLGPWVPAFAGTSGRNAIELSAGK